MGQIDTSRIVQRSNENNLAQNTLINFEKFVWNNNSLNPRM